MTILKCSAANCVYNDAHQCSRGEINVMECHRGCEKIQIECKAHNCAYNDNCKCTAAAIDVDGSRAQCCHETKCGTFACKC